MGSCAANGHQHGRSWLVSVKKKKLRRLSKAGTANFRISKHEQE